MCIRDRALAGSTYGIDQTYTQKLLGFSRIYENSMDAVSDRDYVVEFLSFASLVMMHLSRLSEELILWSSNAVSYTHLILGMPVIVIVTTSYYSIGSSVSNTSSAGPVIRTVPSSK